MEELRNGKFYGTSKKQFYINGLTVVDSNYYNYTDCPWHYHKNAHFAFTTCGKLTETHRKKQILLSPGCLIYNHSQDPHFNSDYSQLVSALHIDIEGSWFNKFDFDSKKIEGVHLFQNPILKALFSRIYGEVKYYDDVSELTIESLVVQALNEMIWESHSNTSLKPAWVDKIKDLLYSENTKPLTLEKIAGEVNIHPVYLCQQFPVYFHSTFGNFVRKIRIEKAIKLMLTKSDISMTEIAYECGFSDQSHFCRLFKTLIGITPLSYQKRVFS